MKLSTVMRRLGPAAILYGLFLVVSDMSGMPVPLLVVMIGLHARSTEEDPIRKAAEREARYRRLELGDDEVLEQEFGWDVPEDREAEELLVLH